MMIRRFIYVCLMTMTLSFVGCSQRKIIPDSELAQIFHDAFLVNSYTTINRVELDSLNLYEPIFERYGYTIEDVQYTIGNFSKRKSARLGDVVESAIKMLEFEGMRYDGEVIILDTIRSISRRKQSEVLWAKDELLVDSRRDTIDLMVCIDDIKVGEYMLKYDYLIDSLDDNVGTYRNNIWFEKDPPRDGKSPKRFQESTKYLQRGKVMSFENSIETTQEYKTMCLQLVDLMNKRKSPHMKLRDIEIIYIPNAEVAEKALFERLVKVNIFSDEHLPTPTPQDSL